MLIWVWNPSRLPYVISQVYSRKNGKKLFIFQTLHSQRQLFFSEENVDSTGWPQKRCFKISLIFFLWDTEMDLDSFPCIPFCLHNQLLGRQDILYVCSLNSWTEREAFEGRSLQPCLRKYLCPGLSFEVFALFILEIFYYFLYGMFSSCEEEEREIVLSIWLVWVGLFVVYF